MGKLKTYIFIFYIIFYTTLGYGIDPVTQAMSCDGQKFNDAALFLTDYLQCLSGDFSLCQSVSDFATGGKIMGGLGNLTTSLYMSSKILSMSKTSLLDAKRKSSDSVYKNVLIRQMGDSEIDKLINKNGGSFEKTLAELDRQLQNIDPEELRKKPQFDLNNIPKENQSKMKQLLENEGKVKTRQSNYKNNIDLMEDLIKKNSNIVASSIENLRKIDDELTKLDDLIKSGAKTENQKIKDRIKHLENLKKVQLESIPITETQTREIAESHNKVINDKIDELEKSYRQEGKSPSKRNLTTINELKRKKIKVPKARINRYSRLILDTSDKGYSLIDVNGKWSSMPEWAKDLRLSQYRALPDLARISIKENPNLVKNVTELIDDIAKREHERYLKYTQDRLIRLYNKDLTFQQIPHLVNESINPISSIEFKNTNLSSKIQLVEPNAKIIPTQVNEAFKRYKPNWDDVNIPYDKLSKDLKERTTEPVSHFFENQFSGTRGRGYLRRYEQFLLRKPLLGKLAGHLTSWGYGGVTTVGLAWYDWYDIQDFLINISYPISDKIRDWTWDKIYPNCRLPDKVELGSQDPIKKPAKFMCECKTSGPPISSLHSSCRTAPSLMGNETKKYCQLSQSSGRDRDLFIAKAYSKLEDSQSELKHILKKGVGCDVMKNQTPNCRHNTEDITLQGMYYLNIIQDNDLFKPIAELCPDVCDQWVTIAKNKANEINQYYKQRKLPSAPSANQSHNQNCDSNFTISKPPLNKPSNLKWQQCQKPILCLPDKKIRVNLTPRKRYEIELDRRTLQPRRVFYHIMTDMGISDEKAVFENINPLSPIINDKKAFMFSFDESGLINSLVKYKFNSSNDIDESYSRDELVDQFGDNFFNTNNPGANLEMFPLAKRFELLDILNQSTEYCCKYEYDCNASLNEFNPVEELQKINQQ